MTGFNDDDNDVYEDANDFVTRQYLLDNGANLQPGSHFHQLGAYIPPSNAMHPTQISPSEIAIGHGNEMGSTGREENMSTHGQQMGRLDMSGMGGLSHREEPSRKRTWTNDDLQQLEMQPPLKQFNQFVKSDPNNFPAPGSSFILSKVPAISVTSIASESFIEGEKRPHLRFLRYRDETWQCLYDESHKPVKIETIVVANDTNFRYSETVRSFINHKRNHTEITVHIECHSDHPPVFISVNGVWKPISQLQLAICGVKDEDLAEEVEIMQMESDRRKATSHLIQPCVLEMLRPRKVQNVVVPRLQFVKSTDGNQKIRTPKQRYYRLVVRLMAVTGDGPVHVVQSYISDRFIVRGSSAKQFKTPDDTEGWKYSDGVMCTDKSLGIGIEPQSGAKLTVGGNIMLTGRILTFSDIETKDEASIVELDKDKAMERLRSYRPVQFSYKKEFALAKGISEQDRHRFSLIAQELQKIHPESVHDDGDYLTIDENRIFYDSIATVQKLIELQEVLELKVDGQVANMQAWSEIFVIRKPKVEDATSNFSDDQGLVNKRPISSSQITIASTYKRKIDRYLVASRYAAYGRSHASMSKITQVTLVALVAVMAVCLMLMTALYFIDWRRHHVAISEMEAKAGEDDSLGMMKKTITMPRHQPGAPPLHDICLHVGCRSYCCDNQFSYATEKRHGGFNVDLVAPLAGSRRAFLAAIAGAEKITPTAFFPKPFLSGTRFEVERMNMTIDSRYCTDRSCNEKKGRYHLFVPISPYMPTTPVLLRITPPPGMFVQSCGHLLNFREEECPSEGGYFRINLNMPTAIEVEPTLFEISAGSYKRSGYRFRVGSSTESCHGSEELFMSSYEEYNIIFYRACGDDLNQDPTTIDIENERDFAFPSKRARVIASAAIST